MGRSYYYFVASLPLLNFDMKPPLTLEEFLDDCRRLLAVDDVRRIEQALFSDPQDVEPTSDIFGRWIDFKQRLRNELTWVRATRAHKDPLEYVRGPRDVDAFMQETINRAVKTADPLEAERILDVGRWQYLDELERGRYFHFDNVLIFALKLQILERYQTYKLPRGQEIFEEYRKFEIVSEKFV